ncbi:MAG TPA: acetate--CoA ligase family protein [Spirochaetota bacterium]|nr:acetate--CoA ligase family protein [Spirochaetota bacterium]
MKEIISRAMGRKQRALSEYDSKSLIHSAGVSTVREKLARSREEALLFAKEFGYPVVLKGCSDRLLHKTEKGMVKLNLGSAEAVGAAWDDITGKDDIGLDGVLVQEQVSGDREFVMGLIRDPQFGPCVMFGLGGIFTEVLKDASFRVAPLSEFDAEEMLEEISARDMLDEFRGSPAVDRDQLVKALVGLGDLAMQYPDIAEIDINPVIVAGNRPVAVDALVVLNS